MAQKWEHLLVFHCWSMADVNWIIVSWENTSKQEGTWETENVWDSHLCWKEVLRFWPKWLPWLSFHITCPLCPACALYCLRRSLHYLTFVSEPRRPKVSSFLQKQLNITFGFVRILITFKSNKQRFASRSPKSSTFSPTFIKLLLKKTFLKIKYLYIAIIL